jgi:hypothetical protein
MFESFGSMAMRPMCSEFFRPTFRQLLPPSSERYNPLPYETLRWLLFSPVPTQTVRGFFGSSAMQPIEYEPSRSKTGAQVMPSLTVFQTPPDALATKKCDGLFGSTANQITRPEVNAGPIERKRKPVKVGVDIGSRGRPSSSPGACSLPASGDGRCAGVGVCAGRVAGSGWAVAGKGINAFKKTRQPVKIKVRNIRGSIRDSPQN